MAHPPPPPYREHAPPPALVGVVECLWTYRADDDESRQAGRVLPDGCTDVLFDLRGSSRVEDEPRPPRFVVGAMTASVSVRHDGPADIVAVRFLPGAARALGGPPASELTDATVDLDALWGPAARELWERIGDAPSVEVRLRVLGDAVRERVERSGAPPDRLVRRAADLLLADVGAPAPTVGELADRLGASRRHLERRFGSDVGVSPWALARIGRLLRATRLMSAPAAPGLAGVAVAAGYHDQAHMTRDFRSLAGTTPGAWRRESRPADAAGPGPEDE